MKKREVDTEQRDTEDLLSDVSQGDRSALGRLLERYRGRLRKTVASRIEPRLAARVSPSDVVQETLFDAVKRMPEFIRDRPVGFFPWLRTLAIQRLISLRRFHVGSSRRSVAREGRQGCSSDVPLGDRVAENGSSPSEHELREEERAQVRAGMEALSASDREVLQLRYVEGLPFDEIAARLGVRVGTVKMRHLRALEHLRAVFEGPVDGVPPP